MSSKPTPQGDTTRIAVEEATACVNSVPLIRFASFSLDVEDPSEREDTVDGHRVHFDQMLNPSGSCAVYPTSPSAPRFYQLIKNRTIATTTFKYPDDDTRGGDTIIGTRFENVNQEDLESGGYQITADWQGDYLR